MKRMIQGNLDNFQLSQDGYWRYGGYVSVSDDEYTIIKELAEEYDIPDRVVASILLRISISKIMSNNEVPDISIYVDNYKRYINNKYSRKKNDNKNFENYFYEEVDTSSHW
jgi:hypothetical protein